MGRRAVGTFSAMAARASAAVSSPSRAAWTRMRSRSAWARPGWRSGRSASGRRGSATSSAASAGSRADAGLPKYARDAASTPTKLPPNGAKDSHIPSTAGLSNRALICTARRLSTSFAPSVRGRGASRRATCMVSVEPPETTRPARAAWPSARAAASGSTPGCS